ncbi:uncharacterized protein BBA_09558 [Beauveria bassiana ARSEF 2860]|uniref:Uncharacterized protein n=1 Tax=Beauveria bassiana (strain ARSEF 2860) TaxID=655819 RepID=J4KL28_BEAB2|nr:uncharacterized protein BBA_09558 [Beauveria bassiana ARSEF 2860]EJP61479.1 hypothetical protein BBA_09558 [Beauveria bassiana ARSEF 2860]
MSLTDAGALMEGLLRRLLNIDNGATDMVTLFMCHGVQIQAGTFQELLDVLQSTDFCSDKLRVLRRHPKILKVLHLVHSQYCNISEAKRGTLVKHFMRRVPSEAIGLVHRMPQQDLALTARDQVLPYKYVIVSESRPRASCPYLGSDRRIYTNDSNRLVEWPNELGIIFGGQGLPRHGHHVQGHPVQNCHIRHYHVRDDPSEATTSMMWTPFSNCVFNETGVETTWVLNIMAINPREGFVDSTHDRAADSDTVQGGGLMGGMPQYAIVTADPKSQPLARDRLVAIAEPNTLRL